MKFLAWVLILCIGVMPVAPTLAMAKDKSDKNCAKTNEVNRENLPPCSETNKGQKDSQKDTAELNQDGAQQSMMLGMMAMAAGGAMIAAGMACSCPGPNGGLIAAGTAMLLAGVAGMNAAHEMSESATAAQYNGADMGHLGKPTGISTDTKTTAGTDTSGNSGTGGISIDDDFTRDGKAGIVFDEFENKTGIGRSELVDAMNNGKSMADVLANAKGLKGMSPEKIQAAMDASGASAMGASELMDKLGMTPEELAALAARNSGEGDDTAIALGAGGKRGPASTDSLGLDGLFAEKPPVGPEAKGAELKGVSPEVQAELDRNGITDLSIFQMIKRRYKSRTPMLFGDTMRKPSSAADNPFANLTGGKVDF